MDTLVFSTNTVNDRTPTRMRVDAAIYEKITQISNITGLTRTKVVDQMLDFALSHAEISTDTTVCPLLTNRNLSIKI